MDLHDYKDVAENYDRYLEVMYEKQDSYDGFLDFYLELAKENGQDGVIDIACGTGAVLLHLAAHGILADGTDLSDAMCNVARQKAESMGANLNIFSSNMTNFKSDRRYSLAIIARSGFMHLLTSEDQRKALLNIRDHLTDGGILTLNTFSPNPLLQASQMQTSPDDYTFRLEYTNTEGQRERIYNAITYDPKTQIMSGNWKFDTLDDTGNVAQSRIRPLAMRQTYKQEFIYLAELCGYEILQIYGDYHKNTEDTGNYVWILRKKDELK